MNNFVATTKLKRDTKAVLNADAPFQIILNNSEVGGILVNKKMAEALLDSDVLQELREELWEAHDPTTSKLIKNARQDKKSDTTTLKAFRQKHDV